MAWGTGTWLIIIACCILLVALVRRIQVRIRRVRAVNRELHQHELELKAVRDKRKHNLAAITMYGAPGSDSGMTPAEEAASFPPAKPGVYRSNGLYESPTMKATRLKASRCQDTCQDYLNYYLDIISHLLAR
jgi:hypothetical protein